MDTEGGCGISLDSGEIFWVTLGTGLVYTGVLDDWVVAALLVSGSEGVDDNGVGVVAGSEAVLVIKLFL